MHVVHYNNLEYKFFNKHSTHPSNGNSPMPQVLQLRGVGKRDGRQWSKLECVFIPVEEL